MSLDAAHPEPSMSRRIWVIGSRFWEWPQAIADVLHHRGPATVVCGDDVGVDVMVAELVDEWGWPLEVDRIRLGESTVDRMTRIRPDYLVAFPLLRSTRVWGIVHACKRAGVPVFVRWAELNAEKEIERALAELSPIEVEAPPEEPPKRPKPKGAATKPAKPAPPPPPPPPPIVRAEAKPVRSKGRAPPVEAPTVVRRRAVTRRNPAEES